MSFFLIKSKYFHYIEVLISTKQAGCIDQLVELLLSKKRAAKMLLFRTLIQEYYYLLPLVFPFGPVPSQTPVPVPVPPPFLKPSPVPSCGCNPLPSPNR